MAIIVNNFSIIENGSQIALDVETLAGYKIVSIRFWNMNTFKDYSLAIDGSYKIVGTNNKEVLIYTNTELNTDLFKDLWFVEITDDVPANECSTCGSPALAITYNLYDYYVCMLNEFTKANTDNCTNCKPTFKASLVTQISLLIDATLKSIELGFYSDAINNINMLKKLCSLSNNCASCECSKCTTCGGFKQIA
jgi:hypothetical protein